MEHHTAQSYVYLHQEHTHKKVGIVLYMHMFQHQKGHLILFMILRRPAYQTSLEPWSDAGQDASAYNGMGSTKPTLYYTQPFNLSRDRTN
jgi:hypothetical protein